jgi:hypothetical protein
MSFFWGTSITLLWWGTSLRFLQRTIGGFSGYRDPPAVATAAREAVNDDRAIVTRRALFYVEQF